MFVENLLKDSCRAQKNWHWVGKRQNPRIFIYFDLWLGRSYFLEQLGSSLENKTQNTRSRCQLPGKGFLSFGETGDFMWGFVHWALSLFQLSRGLGLFLFSTSYFAEPLTATWNKFLEGDHSHRALYLSVYTGKNTVCTCRRLKKIELHILFCPW